MRATVTNRLNGWVHRKVGLPATPRKLRLAWRAGETRQSSPTVIHEVWFTLP